MDKKYLVQRLPKVILGFFGFFVFSLLLSGQAFATTFNYTGGIQTYTVPSTGSYTIEAWGAGGGNATGYTSYPGRGSYIKGTFSLTSGTVLKILVGGQGGNGTYGGGGGGGSFVVDNANNSPYIVAGAGGGARLNNDNRSETDASTTTSGKTPTNGGAGGTSGAGGSIVLQGSPGAGAGLTGNGQGGNGVGGTAFTGGGAGGPACSAGNAGAGAYGGGGGGEWCQWGSSGAGGGYSGGGAAGTISYVGGGGGSYNGGTSPTNTASVQTGNGQVIINSGGGSVTTNTADTATFNSFNIGITTTTSTTLYFGARWGTTNTGNCSTLTYNSPYLVYAGAGTWTNYRYTVGGASPSTSYYYCALTLNNGTGEYSYGNILGPITTQAIPAPAITHLQSSAIDNTTATVGGGIISYVSSPTVTVRWGPSSVACSSLPNSVTATASNRADVNNYSAYSARITGLSSGVSNYWCIVATTSQGTTYSSVSSLTTPSAASTGCSLFPSSTLATAGNETTVFGYLGSSKFQGTRIYQATVNGWTASAFHTAANTQGETITLVKNSANNKIFGAYNPQNWTAAGGVYGTGSNAFLFSLSDGYMLKQFYTTYQAYNNTTYGPTFGGGHDIAFPNATLNSAGSVEYTNAHSYELPSSKGAFTYLHGGTTNQYFTPSEIEVYKLSVCTMSAPTITTPTKTSITASGATLGGNVTSDGGAAVSGRGVCVGTSANPAVGGTCFSTTGTTGVFTVNATGLTQNTLYHYRAYATNSVNTSYTTDDTFTTLQTTPTGVTTSAESNLGSYRVTLNGAANPNGFATTGHFRVFASNPSNCNSDSGGIRIPELAGNDLSIGSGTLAQNYSFTTSFTNGGWLTPNTQYWYCSYAINSSGTSGASATDTFTTPDGAKDPCDPPTTGDLSLSESCTFNDSYDGVDAGTGTTNNALLTFGSGSQTTIGASQIVARGTARFSGGTLAVAAGGLLRGAPVWVKDADGDGVLDDATRLVSPTQPAGYIRRNTLSSTYNYNYKITAINTFDCDPASGNVYQNVANMIKDQDQDRYKTSAAAGVQCVGGTQVAANGRTYYKDSTGSYTWLADADKLSATADCQDNPSGAPCVPVNSSGTNGTNPTASAATTTQINLAWGVNSQGGAVPAVTGYDVYRCGLNQSACGSPSIVNVSNATFSYSNSSLTCSASPYYYKIVAKSGNGDTATAAFSSTTSACCTNTTLYTDADSDTYGTNRTVQYKSASSAIPAGQGGSGTSITLTKPAGVVNGVVMITALTFGGGSGITITPPSGWTLINRQDNAQATPVSLAVYWKAAGGSEPASYAWTFSSSVVSAGGISVYDNVNTSTPVDVFSGNTIATSGSPVTNFTSPAITTTVANDVVVAMYGVFASQANESTVLAWTPPASMSERADKANGNYRAIEIADVLQAGTGSTGTKTASTNAGGYGVSVIIALKPSGTSSVQCLTGGAPAGWSTNQNDCNDNSSALYQNLTGSQDNDGDGYGVDAAHSVCSGASLPSGFGTSGNDCYDTNANVRPGQTSYFTSSRGDGSFDYNCDSVITKDSNWGLSSAAPYTRYESAGCTSNWYGVGGYSWSNQWGSWYCVGGPIDWGTSALILTCAIGSPVDINTYGCGWTAVKPGVYQDSSCASLLYYVSSEQLPCR